MYRGKCIDGRHRVKALRELGVEEVYYENENSQLSIEDIRNKILTVYEEEDTKHLLKKQYLLIENTKGLKNLVIKIGQGIIAESLGTTVKQLGRAKNLEELAGRQIIDCYFKVIKLI